MRQMILEWIPKSARRWPTPNRLLSDLSETYRGRRRLHCPL